MLTKGVKGLSLSTNSNAKVRAESRNKYYTIDFQWTGNVYSWNALSDVSAADAARCWPVVQRAGGQIGHSQPRRCRMLFAMGPYR